MSTVFLDFASLHPEDLDTQRLREALSELKFWPESTSAQISDRLENAETAVVNKIRLTAEHFAAAPKLKLVCLAATGSDNIDLKAASKHGVAVCNIRDYCTPSVVQHVFTLILALTQHLDNYRDQVLAGDWQNSENFCLLDPPFRELSGKTIAIVGLGTLGKAVANVAIAFSMNVIAAQRHNGSKGDASITRLPLTELLTKADIISLHCPLNESTRNIIDAAALAQMKPDALLVNTARGGLVDSAALFAALQSRQIGGAGIDVLPEEPPVKGNVLIDKRLPNLIVTPHIAWSAVESRQRALDEILENIVAFRKGDTRNRLV